MIDPSPWFSIMITSIFGVDAEPVAALTANTDPMAAPAPAMTTAARIRRRGVRPWAPRNRDERRPLAGMLLMVFLMGCPTLSGSVRDALRRTGNPRLAEDDVV